MNRVECHRHIVTLVWLVSLSGWLIAGGFSFSLTASRMPKSASASLGSESPLPTRSIKTEHINLTGSLAVPTVYGGAA
ncbi:MAG: hypothetical protein RMM98_13585, partial [Acidobacteriota bacterium]|nr:hypothetical protein [Acidobacteriota bacterium]